MAYQMLIMFFVFTVLYRITEIINQITYYKLYSNLYKTYLDLGLSKTCNNSLYSLSRFSLSEYSNIMSEDFETLSDYYATMVIRIVEILEAIFIVIYNPIIARTNEERKNRHDKRISLFQELLLSVKEIKGFNIFNVARTRTLNNVTDYLKWNDKLNIDKYNLKQVSLGLIDIFQVIALVIGVSLIARGETTIGVLTIIYNYYAKLNTLYTSIITLFESKINVKIARLRIHKLFQYASSNYGEVEEKNKIAGQIEFKNVLYGNKKDPILNNVSFKILPNTFTVITGASGSGKTGIFDLLLRYNRQHEGSVLVDDTSISKYDSKQIGNIISAVRKNPTFFNMSIRDNLSIFDANFENIVSLCKEFNIHDYIMALDLGYDTVLLTDATNINNDVKYVLAIIRVLLKRTKIMLFDETFDYLSHDISVKVLDALKMMISDNTIVVITKNKEIIESDFVNQVIMLENNKLLATGIHKELNKKNANYSKEFKKL